MKKLRYTRFTDIPKFTRGGSYEVDVPWGYLEEQLEHWNRDGADCPLVLDPDFQRNHVWNEEKQRAYVEYALRGGNGSRLLYWNCSSWMGQYNTPLELVDGKQRLEAARRFLRNDLTVFDGIHLSDFTDKLTMMAPSFRFQVNNLKTRAEVLQWYLDLNTGGVVHTNEEIEKVRLLLEKELNGD